MPDKVERDRYYDAAIIGLRALEAREGRGLRFGPDADATWAAFSGGLHGHGDRLELLLRNAAVVWGPAFDARQIFDLPAVAADDPFGPAWSRRDLQISAVANGPSTLDAAAAALHLAIQPVKLPEANASSRWVLVGPSACVAAAKVFAADASLSWDRQVVAIADLPAHRQLAGLCTLYAAGDAATRVLRSTDGLPQGTVVVSADAGAELLGALGVSA